MSILKVRNKDTGEWIDIQILQGEKGETPTLKVGTTKTGEAGTEANVTMKQEGTEYILDFTIPKGDTPDINLNDYYTKTEIDNMLGDIETLLGGI
jgi:hypothetical protein